MERFFLVILLSLAVLGILSWLASKYAWFSSKKSVAAEDDYIPENDSTESSQCCGQHLVCQKDKFLMGQTDVVYYDDEDLDVYKNIPAASYGENDLALFSEVFYTLQPDDMMGWLNSLRMREIELPLELRDEALMIVSERRDEAQ